MSKYSRVNWQAGMEITPQVLTDADSFHIEQQNLIRRLQVMPCYGLLPESAFNADINIEGSTLLIKDLIVLAITPQGELIDINGKGKEYAKLDLSRYAGSSSLYIYVDGSGNCSIVENPLNDSSGLPVAKIKSMILDINYIPPCISINSNQKLLDAYTEIRRKATDIITQIKEQERYKPIFLPLSMLELELKNYSAFESPIGLFLLLKKFVMPFTLNTSETLELENAENLLNEIYRHTDIHLMFSIVLNCLSVLEEKTKAIEPPVKIEKIKILRDGTPEYPKKKD